MHTWAHSFVGGVWHAAHNASRLGCYAQNTVLVPELFTAGCLRCPDSCAPGAPCTCEAKRLGRGTPSCELLAASLTPTPTFGDFADAWTSPNDPIFFPHHANVDRALMRWQRRHPARAPNYGFPTARGPLPYGHALNDVLAPADPFAVADLFDAARNDSTTLLTNADVLRLTEAALSPYTYDDL